MAGYLARTARVSTCSLRATYSSSVVRTASLSTSAVARASSTDAKDPQLGDYPDLPPINLQTRRYDPRWWDPQEKRNFGETLHEQDDVLGVWAPDVHKTPAFSALLQILTAAGGFGAFAAVIYLSFPGRPANPRTYPREGLATELGSELVAAAKEGAFDGGEDGEEDEAEEDDE
ncbi:hypothetical protein FA10DRAFT_267033 [Acaromyces ingoldii]|uniref:Uncharacterized protein n=1 Tax=Acaromyces ingoldii TaxID=215250 RepID=A0A316YNH3_9BASI|nr:hypothetical protein FA10DRAFT_267033 [Acaromyces ingoldii]PWN90586.1 hypothetical protein FA10DRAFT_267033 [Acaromyces ingoldii]